MQVNQFWRDGFLAGVPVLSEDDCDKLLEEVDAVSFIQIIDFVLKKRLCLISRSTAILLSSDSRWNTPWTSSAV